MKTLFILLLIFSIDFGNEVQMVEAQQCDGHDFPHFCTSKNFIEKLNCKSNCKFACGSFTAHGQCLDDQTCHCRCC
ncbi:hypothetical protein P8452_06135 [Trifolium repens]|nr:hypothetical protein P8452_06135 [Trifolium repens]